MKKTLIALTLSFISIISYSQITYSDNQNNVKVRAINSVSQWFPTDADNVGFGLKVDAGACKVEISLDLVSACKDNTATEFDWELGTLVAGERKFFSYTSGISCGRVNCAAGNGLFFMRRH